MKRFHLSTLLLLTVLAGAFLGLNASRSLGVFQIYIFGELVEVKARGWPFEFQRWSEDATTATSEFPYADIFLPIDKLSLPTLMLNIAVAVTGLALVGYVSEKIIRRKSGRA